MDRLANLKQSSTSIKINTNLVGSFNISNLLAAYGVIVAMKINFKKISK